SIAVRPLLSEDSFGRAFKYRTERIDFFAPKIEVAGIDYQKLLSGQGIFADRVFFSNWIMQVYGDKRLPEEVRSNIEKYPHELFQQMKMPVGIKEIAVRNGNMRYRESWPDTTLPGTITLNHINARTGTISNDPSVAADTFSTPIEGDLRVMDAGFAHFSIGYQLRNPRFSLWCFGTL